MKDVKIAAVISLQKEDHEKLYLVIDEKAGALSCVLLERQSARTSGSALELPSIPEHYLVPAERRSVSMEQVQRVHGEVDSQSYAQALKELTFSDVQTYYRSIHATQQSQPFEAGKSRINYAGRVFGEEEMLNLADATLDFWLTSGKYSDQFEREFAKKIGTRKCLLVNSGSSANLVAFYTLTSPSLKERQVRPGDEVITVAAGFPTTVTPAIQYGAIPVFLDVTVDDGTYNLDVSQLESALSERTRAVMIAHSLGNPFRLGEVKQFCKKNNLWLIEDNCDALGSTYEGQYTGTFGDIATSSFYPPHHLTMGEGGAVYMSDPALARIAASFRDWGRDCWCPAGQDNTCGKRFDWSLGELPQGYDHKYIYSHFGFNLKATDLQASIGVAQLKRLDDFAAARRSNWNLLRNALQDLNDLFVLPEPTPKSDPSWFGFLLTVRDEAPFTRDEITSYLEKNNVQTRLLFAGNLIRHPAFDEMRREQRGFRVIGELPNTDRIMNRTFWVGVYPGMKPGMMDYIAELIRSFCKR